MTSTILGARTVDHLLDNLGALDVTLTAEQTARLDELSKPQLPFPCAFLERVPGGIQNGTTVNGVESERWSLSPTGDDDRY